jgi:adenylate kinase family enzyme
VAIAPWVSSASVRRVSVVGNSGSGKSQLAREIAGKLGVPCLELDSIFHQPGWEPLPQEEFRARVATVAASDAWVIDGNYSAVRPLVWARADTVIWLDLPRRTVTRQIVLRTFRRILTGAELWNGNKEPWANLFSLNPEKSVIAWSWTKHAEYHIRYAAAAEDPANAHLTFVRLRSHAEAGRFLAALTPER